MAEEAFFAALALDADGFLARACPTCDREFMWRGGAQEKSWLSNASEGLFCPYCGIRSPANSWWTQRQLDEARARGLARTNLVALDAALSPLQARAATQPPGCMRRVDFDCHPHDPVKALRAWTKLLHCMICGELGAR